MRQDLLHSPDDINLNVSWIQLNEIVQGDDFAPGCAGEEFKLFRRLLNTVIVEYLDLLKKLRFAHLYCRKSY